VAGTIDLGGDPYVVAVRVEERQTGRVLWSGRFDRPQAAAAAFPEEAANAIAELVHCGLQRRAAAHTALAPAVFGLVLSYCEARRDDPALMLVIARRLVAAAPDLSVAYSMEAAAAGWDAMESSSPADAAALRTTTRIAAARALRLDPRNGEAFLAFALSYGEGAHWLEREKDLERARALDPELTPTLNVRVRLLREVGRVGEALDLSRAANAANPSWSANLAQMATMSAAADDTDSARSALARLDLVDPAYGRDLRWTLAFCGMMSRWPEPRCARWRRRPIGPASNSISGGSTRRNGRCRAAYRQRARLSSSAGGSGC
jgi:hypothetical protein